MAMVKCRFNFWWDFLKKWLILPQKWYFRNIEIVIIFNINTPNDR